MIKWKNKLQITEDGLDFGLIDDFIRLLNKVQNVEVNDTHLNRRAELKKIS